MLTGRWAYKYLGERGRGVGLNYKRQYKVFLKRRYISAIWGNSCQTSQNFMIIFQILSLEISTSHISTALEETQKNSEQINQTLTRTTTHVSYWFNLSFILFFIVRLSCISFFSLRKQSTFGDATIGFTTKWCRLGNECKNSILMTKKLTTSG